MSTPATTAPRLLRPLLRAAAVALVAALASFVPAGPAPLATAGDADTPTPYFSKRIGGVGEHFHLVAAAPDNSVLVAGKANETTPQSGSKHFFVVRAFSPDGKERWTGAIQRFELGHSSDFGGIGALGAAPDGSVWIAGHGLIEDRSVSDPTRADYDAWVAKFDADGKLVFGTMLGGAGYEVAYGLAFMPGGDAIVLGLTGSDDFPFTDGPQDPSGEYVGFVTRVRADGSGFAWSRGFRFAAAVAVDGAGDVVVAGKEVTRFSGDGAWISSGPLFESETGAAVGLAATPDGRVLAGGSILDEHGFASAGFVVPLGPLPVAPGAGWRNRRLAVERLAVGPSGEVLVRTYDNQYDGYGALVLSSDLRRATTIARGRDFWGVDDVAIAPDGARCIVGYLLGVPFNPSVPRTRSHFDDAFVARLPASGADAPSRVRVAGVGERSVDLAWTGDGDRAVAYEVDVLRHPTAYDDRAIRVARVPGSARRMRVDGLRPGTFHELRLVAVFASGVRTAAPVLIVTTRPAPLTGVEARETRRGYIHVVATGNPNGPAATYQCERRVSGGDFGRPASLEPFESSLDAAPSFDFAEFGDSDLGVLGRGAAYRVRAVTTHPRRRSAWTYAFFVRPYPR